MTQDQGCGTNKPCPTGHIMNEFRIEAGNWYTNVKLPNNSEEPLELQASEAGTIAIAKFFTGSVHIKDINNPLKMPPIMTVTLIDKTKLKSREVKYVFYTPKMIANAGGTKKHLGYIKDSMKTKNHLGQKVEDLEGFLRMEIL